MSEQEGFHFAPHVVAGMLDVSVQSVRRWADYHKDYLSATANPPPGTPRGFTWADVEQLRQIKALRESGLSAAAINTRLSDDIRKATNRLPTTVSVVGSQTPQDGLESTPAPLVAPDYLMAIERRFESIERFVIESKQARRDPVQWFALGFLVAGFLFLGMVLLSALYG